MITYTQPQIDAINTLDKNLQIIACAGSGKTQVISQRVVNILKSKPDVHPANIIAFTYTEKAAAELKSRILRLCKEQLGEVQGLAEMYIGTIHAWCLRALQDHVYEFQKYNVLDEIKLKLFVDRNYRFIGMQDLGMDWGKDTGRFVALMGIMREAELAPGKQYPADLLAALQQYEETLHRHCYFDFTMVMTETVKRLEQDQVFRARLAKNLCYLIVDEYQDVNPVQEQLIEHLVGLGPNVCVVGDDDQTIYQWRGSDIRAIQHFRKKYPDVEYIKLEDNFRSTSGVVTTAVTSIGHNVQRLPKAMNAAGHQKYERGDILYNQYDHEADENAFIVNTVRLLRGGAFQDSPDAEVRGLDYADMVVLLRTWKKARLIMAALSEADIPFIVTGVNELFERPEAKAARAIFEYLKDEIGPDALMAYWKAVTPALTEEAIYINMLDEGIDMPNIYTMVVINDNPTEFKTAVKQIVGRGVRLNKEQRRFDEETRDILLTQAEKLHVVCDEDAAFQEVIESIQQDFGLEAGNKLFAFERGDEQPVDNPPKTELLKGIYLPKVRVSFKRRDEVSILDVIGQFETIVEEFMRYNCFAKEETGGEYRYLKGYKPTWASFSDLSSSLTLTKRSHAARADCRKSG